MTDDAAPHIHKDTTWHLLGEFSLPAGLDSEPRLTEWITGAVWELGLQTAQLKRVCEAVIGAVRNTIRHRNQGRRNASVSVRIWLSAAYPRDRSPSGSDATLKTLRERHVKEISPSDAYELIIVPTNSYQTQGALKTLVPFCDEATFLIFSTNWDGTEFIDRLLPRQRYLLGYPDGGGTVRNGIYCTNLGSEVHRGGGVGDGAGI